MNNWLKICKFTLKQALKGSKFITSTIITGLVIFILAIVTNFLVSGAFDKDNKAKELKAVYIVNKTNLELDTDSFIKNHKDDYPSLLISEVAVESAEKAALDFESWGPDRNYSIALEINEDEEGCNLKVYIPPATNLSTSEGYSFASAFKETVKNAKLKNTSISEEELNMAVSNISINEVKAEETDETEEEDNTSFLAGFAPMLVMLVLYFLILFYGQSIGQIVSSEKTSKLMEYLLTLAQPSAIIFGKVTAIFFEALIQIAAWIVCGFGGLAASGVLIKRITGKESANIISLFMEALPEGGISNHFVVLLILSVITLLAAFLFYCFVSALFASFAATAEDLTQTNGMAIMTMVAGFLISLYVPQMVGNADLAKMIIRIIPLTSAFALPGDVLGANIGLIEFIVYLALLLFFTVMLAILTGRVYKNRLFKRGTKGIFEEIVAAITGKEVVSSDEDDSKNKPSKVAINYENYDSAKKAFSIVGFALLALILGANAIGGLVGNVLANIFAAHKQISVVDAYENLTFLTINNIVCMYVIAFPLCALVLKLTDDTRITVKEHITKSQYIRAICMIFPIAIGLGKLSNILASALTGGEAENSVNTLLSGDNILTMIMVAVLAPIFEELIFRKLIIDRTRRYGEFTAIIYSSLAFGLFHCNLYQLLYAFVIGIVLGYVYTRTGNVILTIIMHMCINGTSSIFAPMAPKAYEYFAYTMLVLGIISIIYTLIKRDVKLEPAKNEVASKQLRSIAYINSGTILFTAACLLLMAYQLFAPMLLK